MISSRNLVYHTIIRKAVTPSLARYSSLSLALPICYTARSNSTFGNNSRKFSQTTLKMASNDPPRHEMAYFPNITSPSRSFGVFRKVMHTGLYSQLVAMEVPVNGEIGDEMHTVDQVLIFSHGKGLAIVGGKEQNIKQGDIVIVPAGTQHQFLNTGDTPLELVTVYSPAEHKGTTVHQTKEEGDKQEEAGEDEPPDWSQNSKAENERKGMVRSLK